MFHPRRNDVTLFSIFSPDFLPFSQIYESEQVSVHAVSMNTRGDKELGQRALTEQVFFGTVNTRGEFYV